MDLRHQLLEIVQNADQAILERIADALTQGGAAPRPTLDVGKFSESQGREFEKVKRFVEANRVALDKASGPGKADAMLRDYAELIHQGFRAEDLL